MNTPAPDNATTPFQCSYKFDGHNWALTVYASTLEEAEMKLKAIGRTGKVDGVLHETISADDDIPHTLGHCPTCGKKIRPS